MEFLVKGALEKLFKEHGIELLYAPGIYEYACSISIPKRGRPFDVITQHLEKFVCILKEFDGCARVYVKVEETPRYICTRVAMITNPYESCMHRYVPRTVNSLIQDGITHPLVYFNKKYHQMGAPFLRSNINTTVHIRKGRHRIILT
jgi:hypothetical protein